MEQSPAKPWGTPRQLTAAVVALPLSTRPAAAGSSCCWPLVQVKPTVAMYWVPPVDRSSRHGQTLAVEILSGGCQPGCWRKHLESSRTSRRTKCDEADVER